MAETIKRTRCKSEEERRERRAKSSRKWRENHREQWLAAQKASNAKRYADPEKKAKILADSKAKARLDWATKPEEMRAKHKAWRDKNKSRVLLNGRRWYRGLREEVFAAYGGACSCCWESTYEFLALDHVNGGGSKERKALKGGQAVFVRAKRLGFPGEYQVLCHNCNVAKSAHGECPHKRKSV